MSETNQKNYTDEELEALWDKRTQAMKDNLKHLRVEDEYSRLKANIAKNTADEYMYKVKLAEMSLSQQEKPTSKE